MTTSYQPPSTKTNQFQQSLSLHSKTRKRNYAGNHLDKRVELLRNPCILGGPQRQVRGQNQKWLPCPCLLGGPEQGGIAT